MINHAYVSQNFISKFYIPRDILYQFLFLQSNPIPWSKVHERDRIAIAINNRNAIFVSQLRLSASKQLLDRQSCPPRFCIINQRVNGAGEQKRNIYVAIHF